MDSKKNVFKLFRFFICLVAVYCTGYIATIVIFIIIKPAGSELWLGGAIITFYIYIFFCISVTFVIGFRFFGNKKGKSEKKEGG